MLQYNTQKTKQTDQLTTKFTHKKANKHIHITKQPDNQVNNKIHYSVFSITTIQAIKPNKI